MKAFADPLMAALVERFSVLGSRLHAVHALVTEMGDSGRAEGVKVENVNHQVGVLTGNMGSLKQELSDYQKKQEAELSQLTQAQQWWSAEAEESIRQLTEQTTSFQLFMANAQQQAAQS